VPLASSQESDHKSLRIMPKPKGKGGKNRRRGKGDGEESKRELEFKEDGTYEYWFPLMNRTLQGNTAE
jgi:hypothetical protein